MVGEKSGVSGIVSCSLSNDSLAAVHSGLYVVDWELW